MSSKSIGSREIKERRKKRYFRVSVIVLLSRWTMTNRCLPSPLPKEHVDTSSDLPHEIVSSWECTGLLSTASSMEQYSGIWTLSPPANPKRKLLSGEQRIRNRFTDSLFLRASFWEQWKPECRFPSTFRVTVNYNFASMKFLRVQRSAKGWKESLKINL